MISYEDLQNQVNELALENRKLREENRVLREENRVLREENSVLKRKVQELETALMKFQGLEAKILELEEKLGTDSSNSSKPPSQDPNRKKRSKKSSGKKQGGQPGHKGCYRQIVPLDQVTHVEDIRPTVCPICGSTTFVEEPIKTEVRQVTELPEVKPDVTQYNINTCTCHECGEAVKAGVPDEAKGAFGPRLMGFLCLLSGEFSGTKRKIVNLMGYLNIRLSIGTVCNIQALAGRILEQPCERIREYTLSNNAVNGDETSWKTKGDRQWLWVGTTPDSAFFKIDSSRSAEAFRRVFGKGFKQVLTTDRCASYNVHEGKRQLCLGHIDRDFKKISERQSVDKLFGERLREELAEVFRLWHAFKKRLITRQELQCAVSVLIMPTMKALLILGAVGEACHKKTKRTCRNLLKQFESLWTFLYKEGVEPTNNLAERDVRLGVIWRKISFGTQSESGERFVERILTITTTMKKQARNAFDYLASCFESHIRDGPIPDPLPTH